MRESETSLQINNLKVSRLKQIWVSNTSIVSWLIDYLFEYNKVSWDTKKTFKDYIRNEFLFSKKDNAFFFLELFPIETSITIEKKNFRNRILMKKSSKRYVFRIKNVCRGQKDKRVVD